MGFGQRWCNWIEVCISTVSFSILNGVPKGFFCSSRGLRQGDPLSLPLSNVVMEVLTKLVVKVESEGLVQGCLLSPLGPSVSQLQFAGD